MVLMAGGSSPRGELASAELYDPATRTFALTGSLNTARSWHTSTLLNDGMVLTASGLGPGGVAVVSAELY